MKNYLLIILLCILHLGCQRIGKKDAPKYLATIENIAISEEKVDSVISGQIYRLRKDALKTLLRTTIIDLQAEKVQLTYEEFLKRRLVFNNTVSFEQYSKYLIEQDIDPKNIDTTKIVEYLFALNKKKYFEHFADSLLSESDISINIQPDHYPEVKIDDLDYHEISKGRKITVYIISDFNCHA